VRSGRIPEAVVDQSVRRVLRAKFAAGLFDDPFTDERLAATALLSRENREAARRVAHRSLVLLKNEGAVLPLSPEKGRIALVGPLADSAEDLLGPWAGEGKKEETISILAAMRASLRGGQLVEVADADVIVAVMGESRELSGEAASRSSLDLPDGQQQQLAELAARGKPVVMVLLSGRPLAIPWAAEHVDAIVQAWFPGTEGAQALVDVLLGAVNPSGKLPMTMPRATGQVPIHYAALPTGRPANPEDRWTNKYLDLPIGPLYPFGHGLSYTRFEYSDLRLSAPSIAVDGSLVVSAAVRNAGERAGEEVVQMYVTDLVASVSRPLQELKGFQRIALSAGETKRVSFTIARDQLRFWKKGWLVEPGTFRVMLGGSSAGGVEGRFEVVEKK
jgi:beta-glucosidase